MIANSSLVLLALLLLRPQLFGQESVIRARCVGVTDGDSIRVLAPSNQMLRIRLAWIDSPESSQAFGQRAKQALSELVFGKDVELRSYGLDKYGRTLASVFVDGKDVCLKQVRRGYAWVYEKYIVNSPVEIQTIYRAAQDRAQRLGLGLWSSNPIPPWEFRHAVH